jgi:hypothetical protein
MITRSKNKIQLWATTTFTDCEKQKRPFKASFAADMDWLFIGACFGREGGFQGCGSGFNSALEGGFGSSDSLLASLS